MFVPSGTMSNQLAVKAHTQPGDELICEEFCHIYNWEAGAPAILSGVRRISLGIRPENIAIGSGEANAAVRLVEPTGHESIVTLDLGRGQTMIARVPGDTVLQKGETVRFDLRRDRLHFFDHESGRRLNSDLPA